MMCRGMLLIRVRVRVKLKVKKKVHQVSRAYRQITYRVGSCSVTKPELKALVVSYRGVVAARKCHRDASGEQYRTV